MDNGGGFSSSCVFSSSVLMDRLSIDEYIVDGINNGILSIHSYIYFIFLIFTELFLICMLLQCYSSNSVKQNTKFYFYPLHPF